MEIIPNLSDLQIHIFRHGTITRMLHKKWFQVLSGMISALAMIIIMYFIPPIHERLSWRVELASTYMRGVFNPIHAIPTPLQTPEDFATRTSEPTRLLSPTTTPLVSPTPLPPTFTPTPLPASTSLQAPKFEQQTMNNCGPASLSEYLRYYGWDGNQKSVADVLKPKPEDRNVNVEELVYFVRNYAGWLNIEYRVGGTTSILKTLIANGIPVMIEESFHSDKKYWPTDDLWAGHYLFINGYNNVTQSFIAQDTYYGPDMVLGYSELEKNWQSFNHVFIMIYPPDKEEQVKSILGDDWDVDKNRQRALDDALKATNQEPLNSYNWFNLGSNLVYFDRYGEAAAAYDKARNLGLPQRMLRYQFGPFIAYFNSLRNDDLLALAKDAINVTPNSEEARLWMGWAHYRQGDKEGAYSEFMKAYTLNERYVDAQYALDFLASN
jgi:tetratricopeptide (TPR) repeat protein